MEPHKGDQPDEEGVGARPDLALPDVRIEVDGAGLLSHSVLLDQQEVFKYYGLKFTHLYQLKEDGVIVRERR